MSKDFTKMEISKKIKLELLHDPGIHDRQALAIAQLLNQTKCQLVTKLVFEYVVIIRKLPSTIYHKSYKAYLHLDNGHDHVKA